MTEEVLAWKGFALCIEGNDWKLRSPTMGTIWEGPTLVAAGAPQYDCVGIHALRERDELGPYAQECVALVALSGTVVEGKRGYRARRATVRQVILRYLPECCGDVRPIEVMDVMAKRYQCDVSYEPTTRPPDHLVRQSQYQRMLQYALGAPVPMKLTYSGAA